MKQWCSWLFGGMNIAAIALVPLQARAASADPPAGAAEDVEALRSRIATILVNEHVAGAGVAFVARDGLAWADGIGLADVARQRPATADTPFRLGSVTKNITALAIMQQVERGKLSLDSHLLAVAPDVPFDNAWEQSNPVTIASLLEHTAGFDMYRFNDDVDYGSSPLALLDALKVNPEARRSRWPPGTRMAYSNEGFTSAGLVLETVTGRSFDAAVQDSIFGPLDMHSSAVQLTPSVMQTLAQGYGPNERAEPYFEDMQRPAANLISSARDMQHYLQMWLGRGQANGQTILSADGIARMETRASLPYTGPEAQYGLGTDTAQYDTFVAHGHTGITTGFSASFRYFPREGVGWVVMLNKLPSGDALPAIEAELLAFLMRDASIPVAQVAPATDLARYAGYYTDAAPMQAIAAAMTETFGGTEVQVRSDGLWERTRNVNGLKSLLVADPWQSLIPTDSNGSFRHADEAIASRFFTRAESGAQVLVTPMGYFEQTPMWIVELKRLLVLGSLACMGSALLLIGLSTLQATGVVSMAALGGLPPTLAQLPPVLLAFIGVLTWVMVSHSPQRLSEVNTTTVALYMASVLIPVIGVVSIGTAIGTALSVHVGLMAKTYLTLLALAGGVLSVFAWSAHWLALETWAW